MISEGFRSEKLGSDLLEARSDASFRENNLLRDLHDDKNFVKNQIKNLDKMFEK